MVCKICYTTLQHNLNTHMGVSKHILPFYSFLKITTLDLFADVWFLPNKSVVCNVITRSLGESTAVKYLLFLSTEFFFFGSTTLVALQLKTVW